MADARQRHDWQQTAGVIAQLANAFRGKNKRAVKAEDIHPLAAPKGGRRRRATVSQKEGFAFLKQMVKKKRAKPKATTDRVQDLPQA
jgi:hypothetical protein